MGLDAGLDVMNVKLVTLANSVCAEDHGDVAVSKNRTPCVKGEFAQDLGEGFDYDFLGVIDRVDQEAELIGSGMQH